VTSPTAVIVVNSDARPRLRKKALESAVASVARAGAHIPVVAIVSSPDPRPVPDGVTLVHRTDLRSSIAKRGLAFELAGTDWVIFLDDDCVVTPNGIEVMLEHIALHQESRVGAMFVVTEFVGRRTRWFEAALHSDLMAGFDYARQGQDLLWGTTSLSAFRSSAVREVGAFRETDLPLPAGGEDVDACLRLRRNGWRIYAIPHTLALHATATWSSFGDNARRSRNYGGAEAELVRLHRDQARFGYENLVIALVLGALVAGVVAPWSRLRLLAAGASSWLAGEVQELRARHAEARAVDVAIQLAWSLVYEVGRIQTALRRRDARLLLLRFDWESGEPLQPTLAMRRGIGLRLLTSATAAAATALSAKASR
jgi:hypothetical protein